MDFDSIDLEGLTQGCFSHAIEGGRQSSLVKLHYPDGTKVWYCIILDVGKETIFQQTLEAQESITFSEFGQVVASGYGEPDAGRIAELQREYDIR